MHNKTFIHRAATALLTVCLAATTAWAAYSGGTGTKDDPYLIANANDLNKLAHHLNYGATGYFDDKYFVQTADIDCNGYTYYDTWEPIGKDADHKFGGHYDGGGYTISGLTITTDGEYAGLFGYIKGGTYHGSVTNTSIAEVHGVVLVNPTVTVTATSSTQYAGAVVGLANECARLYDNTVIGGTVTYTGGSNYNTNNSYAGGLIGCYPNSNLAKFSGNKVSGTTVSGGGICGGLVGSYSSYSNCLSGNFADANVSSVEYDNYTDIHTYGYRQGALAGNCNITSGGVSSVNYYHSRNGLTAYGNKVEHHAFSPEPDNAWVSPLYTVSAPDGLTVSGTPTITLNGTDYYAQGATVTLTTDGDHIIGGTPTVSGTGATLGTVATDKQSLTVTVGSQDVTVSATLLTIAGTCSSDGSVTWRMSDANSDGTYETLSINYSGSGTGAMTDYTTSFGIPNTPWKNFLGSITAVNIADGVTHIGNCFLIAAGNLNYGISTISLPASVSSIGESAFAGNANLARVNIGKSNGVVTLAQGNYEFHYCHSSLAIVVPTPTLAVQYATATNWSNYAAKLRVALGSDYLFRIDGTTASDAAYQIADADDLRRLANAVNALTATSGLTFRQTADIDLGGTDFPMIGNDSFSAFRGTYDGQGFAISGLSVSTDRLSVGLFGRIDGATLRGITLVKPSVTTSTTSYLTCCIGSIVGYPLNSTIENCHALQPTLSATGSGSGAKYIGAIAGEAISGNSLTNCCYYGVNAAQANGYGYATLTNVGPARKVTLGDGIASVSPALTDGDGSNGFRYDGTDYYREDVAISLALSGGTLPDGYSQTVSANGTAISGTTYTVNSTDGDVTLAAPIRSDGQTHSVSYIDADGNQQTAQAIALDGSETSLGSYGQEKWYFVGTSFSHTGRIECHGNVHIILCDGKTMNVDGGSSEALWCSLGNLYFYGQSGQTGTLNTTGRISAKGTAANVGTITINGGIINATGDYGIDGYNLVAINGGIVTATGSEGDGIWSNGTITLGWRTSTDRITASSYNGSISVKSGQALVDEDGNILSGDLTASAINGKTLQPAAAAVAFAPEGYATYYNGKNDVTLPAGVKARIVTANDGAALTYATIADGDTDNKVVPAGTAIMLQTAASTETQTKALTLKTKSDATISGTNLLHGSDVEGTTTGDGKHYKLSYNTSGTDLGWYWGADDGAPFATTAHKAWLVLPNGSNARFFGLPDFGETTSLIENGKLIMDNEAGVWYTLDGRKLSGKPAKGVYIVNGRKIVVK